MSYLVPGGVILDPSQGPVPWSPHYQTDKGVRGQLAGKLARGQARLDPLEHLGMGVLQMLPPRQPSFFIYPKSSTPLGG